MSEPAAHLALCRITVATTFHQWNKTNLDYDSLVWAHVCTRIIHVYVLSNKIVLPLIIVASLGYLTHPWMRYHLRINSTLPLMSAPRLVLYCLRGANETINLAYERFYDSAGAPEQLYISYTFMATGEPGCHDLLQIVIVFFLSLSLCMLVYTEFPSS